MKFLISPWRTCACPSLGPTVAALLLPLAIGCASPGLPRPPSLHLPKVVEDLSAQRIGDAVELRWTTPSKATDDLDITGALTAELCRETRPSAAPSQLAGTPSGCVSIKRLPVSLGPSRTTDPLPPALTHDPAVLLSYRIQIFNIHGHSAGLSTAALAISGAAPPPVEHLRATLVRSGIQLEWQPEAASAPVELKRLLITAPAPKPTSNPAARAKQVSDLKPSQSPEVHLGAANPSSDRGGGVDPGGVVDRTAQRDQTYRYTAQRVRKVTLAGHTLELRSPSSPVITVVMHDTFPPAPPSGLAAIPGGTGSLNPSPHVSIDLSWQPVPDLDVAGYIVYRQQLTSTGTLTGSPTRLTLTPVVSPAFSDRTAVPGEAYAYRVTAIDTAGNESAPSADVNETLRNP